MKTFVPFKVIDEFVVLKLNPTKTGLAEASFLNRLFC